MAPQHTLAHHEEMTGPERLSLRVSAMINHPVAQIQRWVTIHRLDTDDDAAWYAVLEEIAETSGVQMLFNEDDTVTLKWERQSDDDRVLEKEWLAAVDEPAPF